MLCRIDLSSSAHFGYDEIAEWPESALDDLVAAGLLSPAGCCSTVTCNGCGEGCLEEVEFVGGGDDEEVRAYVICHGEEGLGRIWVPLTRLETWTADCQTLADALARLLGAKPPAEECVPGRLWWLGRAQLGEATGDAFLAVGACRSDAGEVFGGAGRLSECARPLLLVPSEVPATGLFGLEAQVRSLVMLLSVEGGRLGLDTGAIAELITSGRRKRARAVVPLPTPPGTAWQQVSIRFVDAETVVIRAGAMQEPRDFRELGFADQRNDQPDLQWKLLEFMARNGGVLSWGDRLSPEDIGKRKHQVSTLRRRLIALFGIDGDPIPFQPEKGVYEAEFVMQHTGDAPGENSPNDEEDLSDILPR